MPGPTVTREEHTFVDDDGVTIHYYVWRPAAPRAIVQIVHGLGEYATRYEPLDPGRSSPRATSSTRTTIAATARPVSSSGAATTAKLGHLGTGGVRATAKEIHDLTVLARSENPGLPLVALGQSLGSLFAADDPQRPRRPTTTPSC